ncbi:hypothetical protein ACSBR2_004965 [Camellia fascicularis]
MEQCRGNGGCLYKRRVVTNSRFRFVRFDCSVAADIVIQKANGLLVDDRVLEVKKATYGRSSRVEQSTHQQILRHKQHQGSTVICRPKILCRGTKREHAYYN